MEKNIISLAPVAYEAKAFKSPELQKATERIFKIYRDASAYADKKNREIALILSDVSEKKSYAQDGFESVADYAEKTFGLAKGNAYALARAGKVYKDKEAPEALKALSPSKLDAISSLSPTVVKKALEDGKITAKSTQQELKDFSKKARESEKPTIVSEYCVKFWSNMTHPSLAALDRDNKGKEGHAHHIMEDWDEILRDKVAGITSLDVDTVEVVNLPKGKATENGKKATIRRTLYFNRFFAVVAEFYTYTPIAEEKPVKRAGTIFTVEELREMLSKAEAKQEEQQAQQEEQQAQQEEQQAQQEEQQAQQEEQQAQQEEQQAQQEEQQAQQEEQQAQQEEQQAQQEEQQN